MGPRTKAGDRTRGRGTRVGTAGALALALIPLAAPPAGSEPIRPELEARAAAAAARADGEEPGSAEDEPGGSSGGVWWTVASWDAAGIRSIRASLAGHAGEATGRRVVGVVVVVGSRPGRAVLTNARRVLDLLRAMDVPVRPEDRVRPARSAPLRMGAVVRVARPGVVGDGAEGRERSGPGRPAGDRRHRQCGIASWYRGSGLRAAHRAIAFGTPVRVRDMETGRAVVVVINDRGPYIGGRVVDLSDDAFARLAPLGAGLLDVCISW